MDVSTAIRWLGKLGLIEVSRRPKVLTNEIRSEIVQSLKLGEPLVEIAKAYSLSRVTIDRICNEQPKLHQVWQAANHERKRKEERAKFELEIKSSPNMTMAELRKIQNSGYSWLSRHDKKWLKSKMPAKVVRRSNPVITRKSQIDWISRDNECLSALKVLEATILFEDWERLKPKVVLRKIPTLSFKPRLERLPESRAKVMQMLERAESQGRKYK